MRKEEILLNQLIDGSTPERSKFNIEGTKKKMGWNYIDGVMGKALLDLYDFNHNEKYLEFLDEYIGFYIDEEGNIKGFELEKYNIDSINCGKVLFRLYDYTKKEKYRKAIDTIYNQIKTHPRISTGNFWHKKIYPNQVWLDGIYMCLPFYMEYETKYNKLAQYNDIHNQILNVYNLMSSPDTKLPHHAYDETKKAFWCDKETGMSKNYWSRSVGWYLMALIDIIDIMNEAIYEHKRDYMKIFKEAVDGLLQYVDKETGMLYQVVNMPNREGNYLETSGSSMLAYALLKGVRLDVLPERYLEYGIKTYNGIVDKYLKCEDGEYYLDGICLVAGLGPEDNKRRDGSFEYYISEPIVRNDGKGSGPFFMAYCEMLKIGK